MANNAMPDADFEISGGEGAVIQTLRQGGHPVSKKTFFWPFGPQFGLKITGGGASLDPPL